ncbi:hypothetical protein JOQ06_004152, partial [Pogonophryne albipinna]
MPNTKKPPKTVVHATQQHLVLKANASLKPANVSPDMSVLNSAATEPTNTAILELLQKLSEDQTKHFTDLRKELSETRRAVVAVEEKLADVLTRITSAVARLDMLENTEDQRRNSPPALASEVNLRIYGFPEHSEEKDALSFLKTALSDILQTDFPGGLDLERAHRRTSVMYFLAGSEQLTTATKKDTSQHTSLHAKHVTNHVSDHVTNHVSDHVTSRGKEEDTRRLKNIGEQFLFEPSSNLNSPACLASHGRRSFANSQRPATPSQLDSRFPLKEPRKNINVAPCKAG